MKHTDAQRGLKVYYIPKHAKGNVHHEDVEIGVVTSISTYYVYVQFGTDMWSKGCFAEDLMPVHMY